MTRVTITADSKDATAFLVSVTGKLDHPKALNDALGRRLARELQEHFLQRNTEPNKMAAPKSNFWAGVREDTFLTAVTDAGATVTIGADSHFRIHLLGGTVRPTGGRKFLTIPLIKEARGVRAAVYESQSGRKLFRVGRVLMERTGRAGTAPASKSTLRTKGGYKVFNLSAGSQMRPVYALAREARIPKDPRALPPQSELAAALQQTATAWAASIP